MNQMKSEKNIDICIMCKLITEVHHIPMCWRPYLEFVGDHPICKECISNIVIFKNGTKIATEKLSRCRGEPGISLETLQQFESHVMHLGTKYGTRYLLIIKDNHHIVICCEETCNLTDWSHEILYDKSAFFCTRSFGLVYFAVFYPWEATFTTS